MRDNRGKQKDNRKRALRESMKPNGNKTAPDGACVKRKTYVSGERTHNIKLRNEVKRGYRKSINMELRAAEKGHRDAIISPIGPPLMSFSVA